MRSSTWNLLFFGKVIFSFLISFLIILIFNFFISLFSFFFFFLFFLFFSIFTFFFTFLQLFSLFSLFLRFSRFSLFQVSSLLIENCSFYSAYKLFWTGVSYLQPSHSTHSLQIFTKLSFHAILPTHWVSSLLIENFSFYSAYKPTLRGFYPLVARLPHQSSLNFILHLFILNDNYIQSFNLIGSYDTINAIFGLPLHPLPFRVLAPTWYRLEILYFITLQPNFSSLSQTPQLLVFASQNT